jgi:hypothetical protein
MIRQLVARFVLITLSFLAIGIPLFAHHGTAGVYDYTHRITTKATVTQYKGEEQTRAKRPPSEQEQ